MKTQNKLSSSKQKSKNRWHLSAEGFLLLPSALRPHLLGKKLVKNTRFLAILAFFQIVAMSTIFSYLYSTPVSAASLTLTIPSSFSLDITPGPNGVFSKSSEQSINVKTNNSSGYTLSIKAKSGDNSNSLINNSVSSSSNGNNKLNSISESITEDNFRTDSKFNNTWGYLPNKFNNENNTNFLPGPTSEESLLETTENANEAGKDYGIIIGAKVDNTISSGNYNNDFILSVMANTPKYDAIMQNWTGCASLPDDGNAIVNLLDTRDNNIYTVAKLKDGKCWMTQNLRIQDKEISSEDSDIEEGTFTIPASNLEDFGTEQDTSYIYVDTENKDNGGYYSWYTATAGQSNMAINGSINSICPKGWHLPTKDEFSNLIANSNYDSDSIKAAPANFATPGYVYNKKVSSSGTYGYYWSAGNYNNSSYYSDMFRVYSSSTKPSMNYAYRYYGSSIRCIAGDMEVKDYSITYDLNGGTGGPTPNVETGKFIGNGTMNRSAGSSSTKPSRNNYFFMGWCSVATSTDSCSSKAYYSGENYTLSGGDNIKLYAIWHQSPSSCNSTGVRLKDGKCWSKTKSASVIWDDASSQCSGVWHLPSHDEFNALVKAYWPSASLRTDSKYSTSGYSIGVYTTADYLYADYGGHLSNAWTSTRVGTDRAYYFLSIISTGYNEYRTYNSYPFKSSTGYGNNYYPVICVSS